MKSSEQKKNIITTLIREAFKLEFKTQGGKWNLLFTLLLFAFAVVYIFFGSALVESIFIIATGKPYPLPTLLESLLPFGIMGFLCFLYMIFVADGIKKIQVESEEIREQHKKSISGASNEK